MSKCSLLLRRDTVKQICNPPSQKQKPTIRQKKIPKHIPLPVKSDVFEFSCVFQSIQQNFIKMNSSPISVCKQTELSTRVLESCCCPDDNTSGCVWRLRTRPPPSPFCHLSHTRKQTDVSSQDSMIPGKGSTKIFRAFLLC